MKPVYKNILAILAISITFSCNEDEFLNKQPPGTAAGDAMATPAGVEALLIGAYDMLTGDWNGFGSCMATDWVYGDGYSDNAYKGSSAGDQPWFNELERYTTAPVGQYMEDRWRDCYNGITRANDALTFLGLSTGIPEDRAIEIEAEAKFLRAWYHFKATRIWENIPVVLTVEESGMTPEEVPNSTPGWDEIENDLQFAIDNLGPTPPRGEVGRPDQWAAMAVKAHAHLYQNELDEAKPLLDDIISNGGFSLAPDYNDNYHSETENNVESIFEIQISATAADAGALNANQIGVALPSLWRASPAGFGPQAWGFFQPSQDLFEAFQTTPDGLPVLDKEDRDPLENDMGLASAAEFVPTDHPLDPRVDWTIARRGIPANGWGVFNGASQIREQSNGGPYHTLKYMHWNDGELETSRGTNARNFRAYRYSHVLLWRAEIAVEEGDLDYARELVNMIRNRAMNSQFVKGRVTDYTLDEQPDPGDIDMTQDAANYVISEYPAGHPAFQTQEEARKAVQVESRLEFATEGQRFFNLRRWGIDGEVLNNYIEADVKFRNFLQGAEYDPEQDDYFPLPQTQLDLQPDVLVQDPAY